MTVAAGLTPAERQAFEACGAVRIPAAVPRAETAAMADRLWRSLEKNHGLRRDAPETWTVERPFRHRGVKASGAFAPMGSPAVRAALDDLMGQGGWLEPERWGQPLVCFPGTERPWSLPHQIWHLDGPAEPGSHIRLGRVFVILGPLAAGGGGTIMAAGSHRFVQRLAERNGGPLSSADTRTQLKSLHPWFRDLMSRSDDPAQRITRFTGEDVLADDVPLRVIEMTGEPGDAWLMHPDILHAPAPNVLDTPRMVLTQFVNPKGTTP